MSEHYYDPASGHHFHQQTWGLSRNTFTRIYSDGSGGHATDTVLREHLPTTARLVVDHVLEKTKRETAIQTIIDSFESSFNDDRFDTADEYDRNRGDRVLEALEIPSAIGRFAGQYRGSQSDRAEAFLDLTIRQLHERDFPHKARPLAEFEF